MTLAKPRAPPRSERRRSRRSKRAMRCAIADESSGPPRESAVRSRFRLTLFLPLTSPVPSAASRTYTAWRLVMAWVHRITQTVADEAETEHRQGDGQRWEEPEIPIHAHVLRTIGHHF